MRVQQAIKQDCYFYQIWKKKYRQKNQVLLRELFYQVKHLNIIKIKQVFKNTQIPNYHNVNNIKDSFLLKIYLLSEISQFNLPNEIKHQAFQPSDIERQQQKKQQKQRLNKRIQADFQQKQRLKKRLQAHLEQKQILNNQIQIIKRETGNYECLEVSLRNLQLAAVDENIDVVKSICDNLQKMLKKYQLKDKIKDMKDIKSQTITYSQRMRQTRYLRSSILPLNLVEIIQTKKQIENFRQQVQADDAIIIIGYSGAGKTTLAIGLSGQKINYNEQTKDFRATNPEIAQKLKVTNGWATETRKPNIKQIRKDWANNQSIILIDTAGFRQDINSQIEIANYITTLNMLKQLRSSARIVIVLTKYQFQHNFYQSIKNMIRNITNYLINIIQFRRSIVFIYTKGLTYEMVKKKLKQFFNSQMSQEKWTNNQIEFIYFLKKYHFLDNQQDQHDMQLFQILDPSKHQYKKLVQKIIGSRRTRCPGDFISTTFTLSTINNLKQMTTYLQKMVYKTFELLQFELTKYYLDQIKNIQIIQSRLQSSNSLYKKLQLFLKNQLQQKLKMVGVWFKKYYNHNCEQYIQKIKDVRKYFECIQKSKNLIKQLYKQIQERPLMKIQQLIEDHLKQLIQQLYEAQKMPKSQRLHALSCLKLIKQLRSQNDYQNIKRLIQYKNDQIQYRIVIVLTTSILNQDKWNNVVMDYIGMFRLDGVGNSQAQNYSHLNSIIFKYLQFPPQQYRTIISLLNHAKQYTMNGQLESVCDIYLGKITILTETHVIVKKAVQPNFNQIIKLLEQMNIYYRNQKNQTFLNLDVESVVDLWQVYEQNSQEIYNILLKFSKSLKLSFENIIQKQLTIHRIKQKLFQFIKRFERQIDKLALMPQSIDPFQINKYLNIIFKLTFFVRNRKQANQKSKIKNQIYKDMLAETIQKLEKSLFRIERKIQQTSNNTNVQNQTINYKLILSLFITKQLSSFYQQFFTNESLEQLAIKIQAKLKKPIMDIEKVTFKPDYFQKLLKVLRYMKLLDHQVLIFYNKTKNLLFNADFPNNKSLIKALSQSYQLLLKQKQQNLNSLSLTLCESAVQYILCYKNIRIINQEFSIFTIVDNFNCQYLHKLDLQRLIIQRLQDIYNFMNDPLGPYQLKRQNILELNKEFKFLYQILTKAQEKQIQKFIQTQIKINNLIISTSQDFEDQLSVIEQNFKSVKMGVNFDYLSNLLNEPEYRNQRYRNRISLLFNQINNQYKKQLDQILINFDLKGKVSQKTNIFLDMYQFLKLANQAIESQIINIKFLIPIDLLEQNFKIFFIQLKHNFDYLIKQLECGKQYNRERVIYLSKLKQFQRRIILCLGNQYRSFLNQNFVVSTLQQFFYQQMNQLKLRNQQTYLSENATYNSNYKSFYANTSIQDRKQMKQIAAQKCKRQGQQLKQLLKSDHSKALHIMDRIINVLDQMPQDIQQIFVKTVIQIKQQKLQIEMDIKAKVDNMLRNNIPNDLLVEMKKGFDLKSSTINQILKSVVEKYYLQEKIQFNLKDLKRARQILNKQRDFNKVPLFKQISINYSFLNKCHDQFITFVRLKTKNQIDQNHRKLKCFKKQLVQKNPQQNFRIYDFKSTQANLKYIIDMLQMTSQYPYIFYEETKFMKLFIESEINSANVQLKCYNQKLKKYEQKFMKKKQKINKSDLTSILKEVFIKKQACNRYKLFNKIQIIQVKIENQQIQNTYKIIDTIKQSILERFRSIRHWNVQEFLTNDSIQRILIRYQQIQSDLILLNDFSGLFFHKDQIPQNLLDTIQKQNEIQLRNFQQKVIQDIQFLFKYQKQIETQRIRKFYFLQTLIQKHEIKILPPQMKPNPKIKQLLIDKFKQNTNKIKQFSQSCTKIQQYKKLNSTIDHINYQCNNRLSIKRQQIQVNKKQFQKSHLENLQFKLQIIDVEHPDKQDLIRQIQEEHQIQKTCRYNDFACQYKYAQEHIITQTTKQRQRVHKQINQFLDNQIALNLIINKRARTKFSCEPYILNYPVKIQTLMEKIKTNYTNKIVRHLYYNLGQYDNPYSYSLIEQQKMLSMITKCRYQAKDQIFQKLLQRIPQVTNDRQKKHIILKRYQSYRQKLNELLHSLSDAFTLRNIIDEAKMLGLQLKKQYQNKKQTNFYRQQLLAYICAIWMILKAEKDLDGNVMYTCKPHDGQILAIFLLLEFHNRQYNLPISKAMVQVSSGQGKSIILAVLSAYLALVGFQVFQACYNQYLSARDYKNFQDLFRCLGLQNSIKYNIFPQICKMMLNETPQLSFTDKVYRLITDKNIQSNFESYLKSLLPKNKNNCILLIDEVDTLLDERYIGQSYLPSIKIKTKAIKDLLDFVWSIRQLGQGNLAPYVITRSRQFYQVIRQIDNPIFRSIMQNQAHAMVRDILSFKHDIYCVINDKIFYKQGDEISDKIHYGYRTVFAYYYQCHITQKISVNALNNQAVLSLNVGALSYAQFTKYFTSILGVTGTLEAKSQGQKIILKNQFDIERRYILPSIHPNIYRSVKFKRCYYNRLSEEILYDIDSQHSLNRPILVLFSTQSELYRFFQSQEFSRYQSIASIITSQVKQQDRDYRITVSTQAKKITLMTFNQSRGIDFKLKVKNSNNHPGLHVISAFLPTSYSDYINLIGRTGRHGTNGSATIYISSGNQVPQQETSVERYKAQDDIRINENKIWQLKFNQIRQRLHIAGRQHEEFIQVYNSLKRVDATFYYIKDLNHQVALARQKSRTVICLFLAQSMIQMFPRIIQMTKSAIPNIYRTIDRANIVVQFQIKFIIYRNYNSGYKDVILESNFQNNQDNLVAWLGGVDVAGGFGNQAVEVCLHHLNTIMSLSQFIIISDTKVNPKQQTIQKTKQKGQSYWLKNDYKPTSYQEELNKLIDKQIKVHSYYLNSSTTTKQFYNDLCRKTRGQSKQFKINQQNVTGDLVDFVARKILEDIGSLIGGDLIPRLVQNYQCIRKRYKY